MSLNIPLLAHITYGHSVDILSQVYYGSHPPSLSVRKRHNQRDWSSTQHRDRNLHYFDILGGLAPDTEIIA